MITILTVQQAYENVYIGALIVLAVLILLTFIRVLKGPNVADRIVGVNTIGTLTILMICILSLALNEGYLLDVALLYAMISFLAVVVLTKIYIGVYLERTERRKKQKETEQISDNITQKELQQAEEKQTDRG
jgi:multicomponent Na+:H+ antiporter subunit F